MSKNILLSVLASFIAICVLFSCSKVDSDNTYPVIEYVSLDSKNPLKPGDIMYTDSIYLLTTRFRDAEGLSSYSIQIWSAMMKSSTDTFTLKSSIVPLPEGTPDSAIFNKAFQESNIWGIKDSSVTVFTNVKIDSEITAANKKKLPVVLGDYYLKVTVIDTHGHATRDSILIKVEPKPEEKSPVENDPIIPPVEEEIVPPVENDPII